MALTVAGLKATIYPLPVMCAHLDTDRSSH
jgi:hypothetical protein